MLPRIKTKLIEELVKERDKYITKEVPTDRKGDGLIQVTAATVGFFSEISHHRKAKKSEAQVESNVKTADATPEPPSVSRASQEGASELGPTPKNLAAAFFYRHPTLASIPAQPLQSLATPVLVPQRRPNSRARGFAPAYAPVLADFGIPQNVFLDFVITFNASLKPSPYLNAIKLASFAGEASPEPLIGFLVGEAVEMVTDAIMEAQSRMKSNAFLDKANEGFFAPRGLFAFVGTWRPLDKESEPSTTALPMNTVNTESRPQINVMRTFSHGAEGKTVAKDDWRGFQKRMQRALLPAGGDFGTIVPAPLVWPSTEEIAAATPLDMVKKKSRFDRACLWMDEHVDKHSQVTWTQEHPKHPLASSLPKPEFRSQYADPSHAASSGDVVALLTGGNWHKKEDEKRKEKEAKKQLDKEREKQEKLKSKEEKARLEEEKARLKEHKSKAKAEAANDDASGTNDDDKDTKAELSERGDSENEKSPGEEHKAKEKMKVGLSGLLEDNLLYLIVVQHPSLADYT